MYGDEDEYIKWVNQHLIMLRTMTSTNTVCQTTLFNELSVIEDEDSPDEIVGCREPRRPIIPSSGDTIELNPPISQEPYARFSRK